MSPHSTSTFLAMAAAIAVIMQAGCHRRDDLAPADSGIPASASASVPLDRLRPGELAESAQQVFGFPIPRGMSIERAFPDAVHLVGEASVGELAEYVRRHARVGAPEVIPPRLCFDHARIASQGDEREYRFEISQIGRRVRLIVRDVTPAPTPPGLTDEQRWRQAGLKPDGTPLNISDLR